MRIFTPAARISISLALMTMGVLVTAGLLGLTPDRASSAIEARKLISESLAVQLSLAASKADYSLVTQTMQAFVERNEEVESSALRMADGNIAAQYGDHGKHWQIQPGDKSTTGNIRIPIFQGDEVWGTLEIAYQDVLAGGVLQYLQKTIFGLIIFTGVAGFFGYFFIMRRTLREIDPRAVIPERVKTAFNVLTEGVLILDAKERVVMANLAFSQLVGLEPDRLLGKNASELQWLVAGPGEAPWSKIVKQGMTQLGVNVYYGRDTDQERIFSVNGTPIRDDADNVRGALVTFADITEIQKKNELLQDKNTELNMVVSKLRASELDIKQKNKKLQFFATRDPLSGCSNRRAMFEQAEELMIEARDRGTDLACIMLDIDYFKSINDNHGHAKGDEIIAFLGTLLSSISRLEDIVGRYGGEEFCLFLPGLDQDSAVAVAERIRSALVQESGKQATGGINITGSIGVALLTPLDERLIDLISRADSALYRAKRGGRDRVVIDDDNVTTGMDIDVTGQAVSEDGARMSARAATDVISYASAPADMEYGGYDALTGLPNRTLFADRVQQAIDRACRNESQVAVVSIDIDMFKRVNTTLGHDAGDVLIREIGERFASAIRSTDTIAVLGGGDSTLVLSRLVSDEFGILITELDNTDSIVWIVQRINESLAEKFVIDGSEINVTAALGVSLYPRDGAEPEALIRSAGVAREHAKGGGGRHAVQYYSSEINKMSIMAMEMENELRSALRNGEFELYYQPRVQLETGNITGLEALIRWMHPQKGMIPPVKFMQVAEHSGLITQISSWVMKSACMQARRWVDEGHRDARISVNVSSIEFRSGDVVGQVLQALEESGLSPRNLEIEVTESTFIHNVNNTVEILVALRDMGVNVSIDDFGTGYSTLSYLRDLPIDCLKIDRSFVTDIVTSDRARKLFAAIIAMAHELDLNVVAEGVELQQQLDFLRKHGCDEMQGYIFSRPLPVPEASIMLGATAGGGGDAGKLRRA